MEKINKIFDGLLVLRYKGGDVRAMEILIKRHHNLLCIHAFRYTKDKDLAKDIVQDCWQKALGNIGRLKDPDKFGSWMMTIVTRRSLDVLKKIKKDRALKQKVGKAEETIRLESSEDHTSEALERLKEGIQRLSMDHQMVLRLFYIQQYSMNEISEILGISPGTVKSRLYHAREKLKTYLK